MPFSDTYRPATNHGQLGDAFYDRVAAAAFPAHQLRWRNQPWAERVGLGDLTDDEWIAHFGRFEPLPGSFEAPLALRYHGHQFRSYNPQLGDGRGFLFAQLHDRVDGRLLDLATKGSGHTPWSRSGDGRLTLKGGVREVLATAMLEALGVDTSKSFSLIETGEELMRGDEPSPTRSSVLVRLSHSHIRIGSFQRLAYLKEPENLRRLLDYTIATYMPDLWRETQAERAVLFLERVCRNVARVGAQWTAAGFVHGVLNTDNINVTGESFDYGPWRFLPVYDPAFTAAYFDETRLYAFGRQPDALAWNLTRLAGCLLEIAGQDELERALNAFWPAFREALGVAVVRRLGLVPQDEEANMGLVEPFYAFLEQTRAPFEQTFLDWHGGLASAGRADAELYGSAAFEPVRAVLGAFETAPGLRLDDPYFARAKPCTMLIEEVESLWAPIAERDDWSAFEAKLADIGAMARAYGAA